LQKPPLLFKLSFNMTPPRFEGKPTDPSALAESLHFPFSKRSAPNRFLKAAMTERLSSWSATDYPKRGIPGPEIINVYRRWGEGQFGTILTGNIMIDYDQLEAPGNLIIPPGAEFSGPRFEGFKALATEAKKHGSLVLGQVCHPGRQVEDRIQKDPVSASDVQLTAKMFGVTYAKPHAATQQEIDAIAENFVHAAEFLEKAGYDGIQLHAAHGNPPMLP
jgi:2,4-dienoyl-CoA reductase-like NADH-dependent reductase (Old Yellow Enzyme family)